MSYGRALSERHEHTSNGATVTHLAELVRGNFGGGSEGPLIRSIVLEARLRHDGPPSPQGEKGPSWLSWENSS
jgi:hypothetical protein